MSLTEARDGGRGAAEGVGVVARAARILRALNGVHEGLSLSELAAAADLPRSTVHRLVTAMQAEGLVASAPSSGRTRLGPELARLAMSSRQDIRRELHPFMERLFKDLNETIDLAVLDGDQLRFVDQITAQHPLRAVSAVGENFPLHASANGRILLASIPLGEREALLPRRLKSYTKKTVTDRKKVLAAVAKAERDGIATTREEITEGICAVAVAVRDAFGALAAITVAVPTPRFQGREKEISSALLAVKADAETALGGSALV